VIGPTTPRRSVAALTAVLGYANPPTWVLMSAFAKTYSARTWLGAQRVTSYSNVGIRSAVVCFNVLLILM
jgi:hypothetical protein